MAYKTIVLVGPSAIGKTYLSKLLISKYPNIFEHARVYTTRPKRDNESLIALERIFITDKLFDEQIIKGIFVIYEEFAGYKYGYTKESFSPKNKHLLVDVSPWQISNLTDINDCTMIGLQAPLDFEDMLENRMKSRGDTDAVRKLRHEYIKKDIADLNNIRSIINEHGKFFVVENDATIPSEVAPYIVSCLEVPS